MNKSQKVLLELLKATVKNDKKLSLHETNIDWKSVFEEAKVHQVHGMIYPIIACNTVKDKIPITLIEQWKRETFLIGIKQIQHIHQVAFLLEHMRSKGIEVIALKGLVVRNDYSRPELRTMCDADLLAKREDLIKIDAALVEQGYKPMEASVVHTQYIHPYHYSIEIHWTIKDERVFAGVNYLEDRLWEEAVPVKVGTVQTFSLSLEDFLLHLCIHMATHLSVGGFGIRQIVDLALFIQKHGEKIRWYKFFEKVKMWHLVQFVVVILEICRDQFEVELPRQLEELGRPNSKVVKHLIEDIMTSGVHGKREKVHIISNELAKDTKNGRSSRQSHVLINYLKYFFPAANRLSHEYNYAKNHPILLPIAWLHHLWNGLTGNQYSIWHKVKFLFTSIGLSYKRNKLLRQLDL